MPVALAFVAGAFASVNPCGFALLPAFMSLYLGAHEDSLPRTPTRVVQGLVVGGLMTAGFLGVFVVVGLPISYGATQLTRALPWVGLAIGIVLSLVGLVVLLGKTITVAMPRPVSAPSGRGARTVILFGAAYGIASLACTLPVFLAVLGASLAVQGTAGAFVVFGAYGLGMALVLMALSVATAVFKDGRARAMRRILPYVGRLAGALLVLTGAYLTYYWAKAIWAPVSELSRDPLIGIVQSFVSGVQRIAVSGDGRWLVLGAGLAVLAAAVVALWRWALGTDVPHVEGGEAAVVPDQAPPEACCDDASAPEHRVAPKATERR